MANEYTLADYELVAPDDLNKAAIHTYREASPIMDMLSFKPSNQLSERIIRYGSVPVTPWRNIGEDYTQVKVTPDFTAERLYFMGAKIDVPVEYTKAGQMQDIRTEQSQAALMGQAFAFNDCFFNNTPVTDPKAIVGIWYRLINDLATVQSVNGAGIDISPNTLLTTAAWTSGLFDLVERALHRVDGNPSDKVIFMGYELFNRFQTACRSSNLLSTSVDQIGRQFLTYGNGGPKIIDPGYKYDQTTQILGDGENAAGTALSGSTFSSLFVVRFGAPYLDGWCQEPPKAEDVGLLEDRVNVRTVINFSAGLRLSHPRAIARVYNMQVS